MILDVFKQLTEKIINPDGLINKRYRCFRNLLDSDRNAHVALDRLEQDYYRGESVDINRIRSRAADLSAEVFSMIDNLFVLAPGRFRSILDYYKKIDFYIRYALAPPRIDVSPPYVLPLNGTYRDDLLVGGKSLHLSQLSEKLDVPVPPGFVVATTAWNRVVEDNDLRPFINRELTHVDIRSLSQITEVSRVIIDRIMNSSVPDEIEKAVAGELLRPEFAGVSGFAVRSSCVSEDSRLSFAGQYRSILDVSADKIGEACRAVMASKYTPEALVYRIRNGIDDEALPMAVLILPMIKAIYSGVAVSRAPSPREFGCCIHVTDGRGDKLMAGEVASRVVDVDLSGGKTPLLHGDPELIERIGPLLSQIAEYSQKIHAFFDCAQEIEWCVDQDRQLSILQSRFAGEERVAPEPIQNQPAARFDDLLFKSGISAAIGTATGTVKVVEAVDQLAALPDRTIIVCDTTPPALVKTLPHVAGVIARFGNSADHFSSVAREFGIPVLVQVGEPADLLKDGMHVTLDSERTAVYKGFNEAAGTPRTDARHDPESPVGRAFKMVIDFCSPLRLLDPNDKGFSPEGCRSLHDIIRFVHEKATEAMFLQNPDTFFRKPKCALLATEIPLVMYVMDVGGGLSVAVDKQEIVKEDDILSEPFRRLWQGMTHPGVDWHGRSHFDWQSYDAVALAGGISSTRDSSLASYCLLGTEYMNVSIRFGYHFTLIDSYCGDTPEENYVLFRFTGGGGTDYGKDLRLDFLSKVFGRLGFSCERSGDLFDARIQRHQKELMLPQFETIGSLLGAVRLLDMVLKQEEQVDRLVEAFFRGEYDYFQDCS